MFKIELVINFGLQDDYGDERETNLAAVISAAAQWGGLKVVIKNGHTNAHHRLLLFVTKQLQDSILISHVKYYLL